LRQYCAYVVMTDDVTSAEAAAQRYQSLFPDVVGVSSRELLRESLLPSSSTFTTPAVDWKLNGHTVLLVDVRTKSERDVSMISGAVSLDEFKANVLPSLESKPAVDGDSALPDMIVTYCTIGFRSGMEARKLIHDYPKLFVGWDHDDNSTNNEDDRTSTTMVGNLDGMLAFANACLEYQRSDNDQSPIDPVIIDRKTNTATNKVHVYGESWKKYLSHPFEAITFSKVEFAWRGLLVLGRSCSSCNTSFVCCMR
jgi:rhodanese-related sulfurtransferase